jgi:hypothetical protein
MAYCRLFVAVLFLSPDVFFATEWSALWMRANRWIGFAQKVFCGRRLRRRLRSPPQAVVVSQGRFGVRTPPTDFLCKASLNIYARSPYQSGWPISMRKFWEVWSRARLVAEATQAELGSVAHLTMDASALTLPARKRGDGSRGTKKLVVAGLGGYHPAFGAGGSDSFSRRLSPRSSSRNPGSGNYVILHATSPAQATSRRTTGRAPGAERQFEDDRRGARTAHCRQRAVRSGQ